MCSKRPTIHGGMTVITKQKKSKVEVKQNENLARMASLSRNKVIKTHNTARRPCPLAIFQYLSPLSKASCVFS